MAIRRRNHAANVPRDRTARSHRFRSRVRVPAQPLVAGATTDSSWRWKNETRHQRAAALRPGAHQGHRPESRQQGRHRAPLPDLRRPREDPEAMGRGVRASAFGTAFVGGRQPRGTAGDGSAIGPGAGARQAGTAPRTRQARVARERPPRTAPAPRARGHMGQGLAIASDGHRRRRPILARTSRRDRCRGGECGRMLAGKTPETPPVARRDPFAAESDVRRQTDASLPGMPCARGSRRRRKSRRRSACPDGANPKRTRRPRRRVDLARKIGRASEEDAKRISKPANRSSPGWRRRRSRLPTAKSG